MSEEFGLIYLILGAIFLFFEGVAVGSTAKGDTFSEWFRYVVVRRWYLKWPAVGFWIWLGYHFFIDTGL